MSLIFHPYAPVRIARADPPKLWCPHEMALVGKSCIDRWEATLVEVHRDHRETPWTPYYTPMGHVVRAVSQPGVVPQGHISMAIAWDACKVAGKRLCRAKEWVAACRGPDDDDWPYGPVRIPGACIDFGRTYALPKLHPGAEMYENRTMNDPRLNQVDNTVALTGSASACSNPLGVYDMVGNLNEWIDDQTMRGGFYLDVEQLGEGCGYATKAHSKVYNDYSTGFRCCMDAEVEPVRLESALGYRPGLIDLLYDVSIALPKVGEFIGTLVQQGPTEPSPPSG